MIGGRLYSDDTTLIKGGYVLTLDPELGDLPHTDVLIQGDKIAAVGKDLEASPHANVVDARDRIVMPGFVDTHRHTWQTPVRGVLPSCTLDQYFSGMLDNIGIQYRAEDVYIANLMGALEAINGGITTLLDWSHVNNTPEHADAAIHGLAEPQVSRLPEGGDPYTGVVDPFRIVIEDHPGAHGPYLLVQIEGGYQVSEPSWGHTGIVVERHAVGASSRFESLVHGLCESQIAPVPNEPYLGESIRHPLGAAVHGAVFNQNGFKGVEVLLEYGFQAFTQKAFAVPVGNNYGDSDIVHGGERIDPHLYSTDFNRLPRIAGLRTRRRRNTFNAPVSRFRDCVAIS